MFVLECMMHFMERCAITFSVRDITVDISTSFFFEHVYIQEEMFLSIVIINGVVIRSCIRIFNHQQSALASFNNI